MLRFTADWFSRRVPHWERLFARLRWDAAAPHHVVEIGCHEGRASLWILANLLRHPQSRLYCIDVFDPTEVNPDPQASFLANLREAGEEQRVTLLRERSFAGCVRLLAEGVRADFVYIDGSHCAADVLDDLVMGFKLLRVGGLIVCDDYLWAAEEPGREDVLNTPKLAVDAFTSIYRRKLEIPPGQQLYQFAFTKRCD